MLGLPGVGPGQRVALGVRIQGKWPGPGGHRRQNGESPEAQGPAEEAGAQCKVRTGMVTKCGEETPHRIVSKSTARHAAAGLQRVGEQSGHAGAPHFPLSLAALWASSQGGAVLPVHVHEQGPCVRLGSPGEDGGQSSTRGVLRAFNVVRSRACGLIKTISLPRSPQRKCSRFEKNEEWSSERSLGPERVEEAWLLHR